MSSKANPKVYMDIQIGPKGAGRLIFELFTDFTPKTAENFRGLCVGDYSCPETRTRLTYLNSRFHRVTTGLVVQGGDITNRNGTGGCSIYGRTFADESFARKHASAGLLSMANSGRNTNASQFMVTLKAAPELDERHVVFGQLIDGIEVLRQIAKVPVDGRDQPRVPVVVVGCGEVGDFKSFLTFDPFQKSAEDKIRTKREEIIRDQHLMRRLIAEGIDTNEAYSYKRKLERCEKDLAELLKQEQLLSLQSREAPVNAEPSPSEEDPAPSLPPSVLNRLSGSALSAFLDLRLQLNHARTQNAKAALEEELRENDMHYRKTLKRQ
jgi:cyclophilin family peptidyl-prolyl cis-trans isomerase